MRKRGIQHIHAYCVDNCLVKVADPVFIGFAAAKEVDIATKVVRKRNAKESVGLILQKNGKPDVVEYSEIDNATAEAKDSNKPDLLKFRAANIVNHYYSFRFLETIEEWVHELPHHVARKKIPYVDIEKGETVKPTTPNGIKLEQFVFDVFPLTRLEKFACMEVKREEEFSPLKNAKGTGEDDPDTSKQDILNQGRRWVQNVGGMVESEVAPEETGVEVSPLVSYVGPGESRVVSSSPLTGFPGRRGSRIPPDANDQSACCHRKGRLMGRKRAWRKCHGRMQLWRSCRNEKTFDRASCILFSAAMNLHVRQQTFGQVNATPAIRGEGR